ncbi:MAG: hypothetical protein JO336_04010 [Acidobacteriia bacterium]|nr:hypothetical protein [Terriglobia bacterium]MBV8904006.1 hypothetical protein [Terriglobia bacterium]
MKNKLLTLGGAAALLAVVGHYYAKPLMAQVRAALVQNVDEPGRNPFSLQVQALAPADDFVTFQVPAKQRYVIEQYSVGCSQVSSVAGVSIEANNAPEGVTSGPAYAPGFQFFPTFWAASGTTRLYANPNTVISMRVAGSLTSTTTCTYSVAGYSINQP